MKSKKNVFILILLLIIILLLFINNKDSFINTMLNKIKVDDKIIPNINTTFNNTTLKIKDLELDNIIISDANNNINYFYIYDIFNKSIIPRMFELNDKYHELYNTIPPNYKARGGRGDIITFYTADLKNYYQNHIDTYIRYLYSIAKQTRLDYKKFFVSSDKLTITDETRKTKIKEDKDEILKIVCQQLDQLLTYINNDILDINNKIMLYNNQSIIKSTNKNILFPPIGPRIDPADRYKLFAMYDTK